MRSIKKVRKPFLAELRLSLMVGTGQIYHVLSLFTGFRIQAGRKSNYKTLHTFHDSGNNSDASSAKSKPKL